VAPAPASPPPEPPLPAWRQPYFYLGTLHDPLAQPRFVLPFLAFGGGFFPIEGLHFFGQLSAQAYRIEDRAAGVDYRFAADHGQLGVGYLLPIRRGFVGFVFDARFGAIRLRARGENGPGIRGMDEVVWNPIFSTNGGFFARTRGPVAFRLTVGFRTQMHDVRVYVADEVARVAQAEGYALQWQIEVAP
jgi:hypothetical protein